MTSLLLQWSLGKWWCNLLTLCPGMDTGYFYTFNISVVFFEVFGPLVMLLYVWLYPWQGSTVILTLEVKSSREADRCPQKHDPEVDVDSHSGPGCVHLRRGDVMGNLVPVLVILVGKVQKDVLLEPAVDLDVTVVQQGCRRAGWPFFYERNIYFWFSSKKADRRILNQKRDSLSYVCNVAKCYRFLPVLHLELQWTNCPVLYTCSPLSSTLVEHHSILLTSPTRVHSL